MATEQADRSNTTLIVVKGNKDYKRNCDLGKTKPRMAYHHKENLASCSICASSTRHDSKSYSTLFTEETSLELKHCCDNSEPNHNNKLSCSKLKIENGQVWNTGGATAKPCITSSDIDLSASSCRILEMETVEQQTDSDADSLHCTKAKQPSVPLFNHLNHDEFLNVYYESSSMTVKDDCEEIKTENSDQSTVTTENRILLSNSSDINTMEVNTTNFTPDNSFEGVFEKSRLIHKASSVDFLLLDDKDNIERQSGVQSENNFSHSRKLKHYLISFQEIMGTIRKKINYLEVQQNHISKDSEFYESSHKTEADRRENRLMSKVISSGAFHYAIAKVEVFTLTAIKSIPWKLLNEEKWRLHTYSMYPHNASKSAILLAQAGFVYLGSGKSGEDKVICVFCNGVKEGWLISDDIQHVHRTLSKDCPMVTGKPCNNVSMSIPANGVNLFYQLEAARDEEISRESFQKPESELERDGIEDSSFLTVSSIVEGSQSSELAHAAQPAQTANQLAHGKQPVQSANQPVAVPVPFTISQETASSTLSTPQQPCQSSDPSTAYRDIGSSVGTLGSTQAHGVPTGLANSVESSAGAGSPAPFREPSAQPQLTTTTSTQSLETDNISTAEHMTETVAPPTSTTSSVPSILESATGGSEPPPNSTGTTGGSDPPSNPSSAEAGSETPRPNRTPSYGELGIITERPKRFEYAVRAKRFESFEHWPADHHLKKEDLSDAGFYYAGYGDCARCFYCGGGLRNWEDNDNVWVEHGRWFPKCAYIRQTMGQPFVDAVQNLNKTNDQISFEMVMKEMGSSAASFQLDTKNSPLKRDPAVMTVIGMGFDEKDVIEAAYSVKDTYGSLSADKLFEKLQKDRKKRRPSTAPVESQAIRSKDSSKDEVVMNQLKEQNNQLRQQTVCKICMDKEVAVVFLPCGHLVSCTDCAAALKDCPVCRNSVRGIVRAFMA